MAQQMPVAEREKLVELFNRHPFAQELGQRFRKEGEIGAIRMAILDFLESRFDERPASVAAALDTIQDLERLKKLRREVFKADTLEEALKVIAQAADGARGH